MPKVLVTLTCVYDANDDEAVWMKDLAQEEQIIPYTSRAIVNKSEELQIVKVEDNMK